MSLSLNNTVYVVKWRQNPIFLPLGASVTAPAGTCSAENGERPCVTVMGGGAPLTRWAMIWASKGTKLAWHNCILLFPWGKCVQMSTINVILNLRMGSWSQN